MVTSGTSETSVNNVTVGESLNLKELCDVSKHTCENCGKNYSTNSNLNKHRRKCKILKLGDAVINRINKNKQDILDAKNTIIAENKQMLSELNKLLEKVERRPSTMTNNMLINNTQNNIIINSHGHENLSYITQTYLNSLIGIPYGAVPRLLKNIYFHPKHPENHNVKITNKKLPYISIYKNNRWEVHYKQIVLQNMLDSGYNLIDYHYEQDKSKLSQKENEKYKRFQKDYDNNSKFKKRLEKDLELTILNHRQKLTLGN